MERWKRLKDGIQWPEAASTSDGLRRRPLYERKLLNPNKEAVEKESPEAERDAKAGGSGKKLSS